MNRRTFLRSLFGATAVAAIPAPIVKYFFAPVGGWESDLIAHPDEVWDGNLYRDYGTINRTTMDYIVPQLTDNYFKVSHLFREPNRVDPVRILSGRIRVPLTYVQGVER